jgi:hypothetical protein
VNLRKSKGTVATDLCLPLDHTKVELILVPQARLFLQPLEPILFRVVVPGTLDVVLVLLEQPESASVRELPSLLVVPTVDRVFTRGGFRLVGSGLVACKGGRTVLRREEPTMLRVKDAVGGNTPNPGFSPNAHKRNPTRYPLSNLASYVRPLGRFGTTPS